MKLKLRPANVGQDAMTKEERLRQHEIALKRLGIKRPKVKK